MATHGHVVRFVARPGKRDELVAILKPMFNEVEKEPGTLLYLMHLSDNEPDVVWFYERYQDKAAFEIHRTSATHDAVLASLKPVLAAPPEIHWLSLVAGKGLPSPASGGAPG
ncbi:antibiotic biosynthesis monooxygenase [Vineibacter terrae]|uniref:Antibiotic biosynthesis monooxygenase n=1 Tax=Vineibacter terrae TaxID=2586908 RepID=A0A5C8PQP2_9HYPH|nr:putative quinol monooxygenase [Vineibacter terrae]TXL78137.1 antibiotic biosynthesis monooxygenase [Vineibacter terrae]